MAVTVEDLDQRVTALERTQIETTETLRWAAATLGRMQALQDEHTQRLERIETTLADHTQRLDGIDVRLDRIEGRLDRLEAKVDAFPRAVAEQLEASERRLLAAIAGR
jgi:chromosome segregation ATPase